MRKYDIKKTVQRVGLAAGIGLVATLGSGCVTPAANNPVSGTDYFGSMLHGFGALGAAAVGDTEGVRINTLMKSTYDNNMAHDRRVREAEAGRSQFNQTINVGGQTPQYEEKGHWEIMIIDGRRHRLFFPD